MSPGFTVLCAPDGAVRSSYGDGTVTPGTSLSTLVARDSRERLLQILNDARGADQHSILQVSDGTTLEVHCAGDHARILVVAAPTVAEVRRRCTEIFEDADVGALSRRIHATAGPDELSLDLWGELARVNNDLATAQRQLAKNNAELRWLNDQKNQLLGMAAHDLRNPLAVILAYTQFISGEVPDLSPEHRKMLGRIQANAEDMLGMVEEVLDFSAIESGIVRLDPSPFELADLIDDIAGINGLLAERKSIHIASSVDAGVPQLVADKRKLAQVLTNLVTNAIKFSHAGSVVTITGGSDDGGGVRISVTDQGVGMTADQAARLFKPFGRVGVEATAGEKSTGLGLAIVKRIVEAHRGRVDVVSAPGEGTTFTISLPASCTVART